RQIAGDDLGVVPQLLNAVEELVPVGLRAAGAADRLEQHDRAPDCGRLLGDLLIGLRRRTTPARPQDEPDARRGHDPGLHTTTFNGHVCLPLARFLGSQGEDAAAHRSYAFANATSQNAYEA